MRAAPGSPGASVTRVTTAIFVVIVLVAGGYRFQQQLDQRLDPKLEGAELWVQGSVDSLPRQTPDFHQFLFKPGRRQAVLAGIPDTIQVTWAQPPRQVDPGVTLHLKLRFKPPIGLVNFQGYDREQSLFAAGIGALATVVDYRASPQENTGDFMLLKARDAVRKRIRDVLPEGEPRALLLALAIADRSELEGDSWNVLRITGTGHLLAISGLHIGLAGVIGFFVVRLFVPLLAWFKSGNRAMVACSIGSFLTALGYGALAGFPVSTLRALAMLAVALALLCSRRATNPLRAWAIAVGLVLLLDPFAPLTPGFWLSFGAVLALLLYFSPRPQAPTWWSTLPRAQLAVTAVTLPLGIYWFQAGAWLSLPANLLAIPWVSLVSVPLVLATLATWPFATLGEWPLELAWWSCQALSWFLTTLADHAGGKVWQTPVASFASVALAIAGGLLLLLPRGLAIRWLGLCLMLPLLLPRAPTLDAGSYRVENLDVGQGQAVLVETRNHTLLYDTGPGDGEGRDLVGSVIAPALARDGKSAPDLVVVSHGDLDHAGGLQTLRDHFGELSIRYNRRNPQAEPPLCHDSQNWNWDGVHFQVLHPSRWLPYQGNDSSCVISIDNGRHRTLLSGDISIVIEDRLAHSLDDYYLLTVPHHGSASSSGHALLFAARPQLAVASAAYGNRFGFPRPEVTQRYQRLGSTLLSTIDCGAVSTYFPVDGKPRSSAARLARDAPWRWHPPISCMASSEPGMYHLPRKNSKE